MSLVDIGYFCDKLQVRRCEGVKAAGFILESGFGYVCIAVRLPGVTHEVRFR